MSTPSLGSGTFQLDHAGDFKLTSSESHGSPPNGGGGGNGYARNITFRNVNMKDIIHPIAVDTTLTYLPDVKGQPHIAPSNFE